MSILSEFIQSSSCCLLVISFMPLMLNVATFSRMLVGTFVGAMLLLVSYVFFPHCFMASSIAKAFFLTFFLKVSGVWEVFPVPLVKGWHGGVTISLLAHSRHFLYILLCAEVFIFRCMFRSCVELSLLRPRLEFRAVGVFVSAGTEVPRPFRRAA